VNVTFDPTERVERSESLLRRGRTAGTAEHAEHAEAGDKFDDAEIRLRVLSLLGGLVSGTVSGTGSVIFGVIS